MANSAIEGLLTDVSVILLDTDQCVGRFMDAFSTLSETAIKFINQYDEYVYETIYDTDYLKARIKDTIMKAVADELH